MALNLVLMGLPGAGKGTQAEKIIKEFAIPHISTGDIFREAMANETEMGLEAKKFIDKGELVPDEVTVGIVKDRLAQPDTKDGFMLDGFPRTLVQANALDEILAELNKPLTAVINFDVEPELLADRLLARGRADDTPATIKNRLEVNIKMNTPLIDFYNGKGLLHTIDGARDIDVVFADTQEILKSL
ncbi:adenylate kinase [Periweissella fabaria]|uniref:Adenylate kinase n=1 Tax=Periweissella fabaria TaxID=546157 RepID=A0ABM8Z5J6_9LACO|nr:adenylate kinase [Periweissella fabaria]MCM0596850.1 adenylate kinase [Periweissella fabaria]CAH0416587.1 Adenylate kinase [Periweissella fabaria]